MLPAMASRKTLGAIALASALTILAACGDSSGTSARSHSTPTSVAGEVSPAGDIPDTQTYVPYSSPTGAYSITVPEGWARSGTGDSATFTDKYNSIRIDRASAAASPTPLSAEANDIPRLRADGATNISGARTVRRKAGRAVRITYVAKSPPDPTTGKTAPLAVERYQFWKNANLVTLTLAGAQGSDNVDPWRTVTDSFAWVP